MCVHEILVLIDFSLKCILMMMVMMTAAILVFPNGIGFDPKVIWTLDLGMWMNTGRLKERFRVSLLDPLLSGLGILASSS